LLKLTISERVAVFLIILCTLIGPANAYIARSIPLPEANVIFYPLKVWVDAAVRRRNKYWCEIRLESTVEVLGDGFGYLCVGDIAGGEFLDITDMFFTIRGILFVDDSGPPNKLDMKNYTKVAVLVGLPYVAIMAAVHGFGWFLVLAIVGILYFLPTICALNAKHHNVDAIAIVNLFLGWTFVGWVVALAMAVTKSEKNQKQKDNRV